MTTEQLHLYYWALICLAAACVTATAFPVLYTFSPWFKSRLGWAAMLRGVAFAMALDLTLIFQFFDPGLTIMLWVNAVVFTFIAGVSIFWTSTMCSMNYKKRQRRKKEERDEHRRRLVRLHPTPRERA